MIALTLAVLLSPSAWAEPARTISIGLDPGLELMGVVELLGGRSPKDKGFAAPDSRDMRRTRRRFASWSAEAAQTWALGKGESCAYLRRSDALIRSDLTSPPELSARSVIPADFVECLGGPKGLNAWLDGLRRFAVKSNFAEYFAAETARWEPGVEGFRREAAAADFIGKIERYTGLPFHGTYAMPLSGRHSPGGQVNSVIPNEDGSTRIVSLLGPHSRAEGQVVIVMDEILSTAWHELAHGILDRVSDVYRDEVRKRSAVQKTLPWDCYGGWEQCFKENLVRAVMIRLVTLEKGAQFGERVLQEEGPKKYPHLAALVELLKEYESDRARYPTVAHFYPRLLSVFPSGSSPEPEASPAADAVDPGPNWLDGAAAPFATSGQREKALEVLDAVLAGRASPDPDLLLRRAVLRLGQNLHDGARQDAEAVLRARPGSSAALYLAALVREAKGQEAVAALRQAARSCVAAGSEVALCRSIKARLALATTGRVRPGITPREPISFEADPRVELLGVVQMLAEPEAFVRQFSAAPPSYAEYGREAWKVFSPWSGHPAVAGLKRLRQENRLLETVAGLLALSVPPELAAHPDSNDGETPSTDGKFLEELRDFSRRSGFMEFYGKNAAFYRLMGEGARKESLQGQTPSSVYSYLRESKKRRHRFVLTPLLPRQMAANARVSDSGERLSVRIRPADYSGKSLFDMGDFGSTPAHEIGHELLDSFAFEHRAELEAYAGLMVKDCTDSWMGCVLEHVDLAVTLRALAAERGEAAYQRTLAEFKERGFPYLETLCRRLKEWESGSEGSFGKFYPRLVSVFRESLLKDASAEARATLERRARQAAAVQAATPAPRTSTSPITDPRLELAAALIGLAEQSDPAGPFAAFSSHAAVGKARRLLQADKERTLPAQLMLYVSSPPALLPTGQVPEGYMIRAGGQDAVDEFYEAARDFAVQSNFAGHYQSSAGAYQDLARRHAERLKTIVPASGRLIVSALLPARYWARLVRITRDAPPEIWTLAASGMLDEGGAGKPGSGVEIGMKVDPRVELLSVLLLLHRSPGGSPAPKSPYQQDAERWFSSFSTHPAVAQTAALLKSNPATNLPAQIMLRLSEPPDMFTSDPIPGGYLDAAGGEAVVDRFIEALGDFAKISRFTTFYEAHRADYAAFSAAAEKETLSTISPKAIQAYLGASLSDRYSFILAPLLDEERAMNLTLRHFDRLEEIRLRPPRHTPGRGARFLFDKFDASVAHDLCHTVTNPLVTGLATTGAQEHLVHAVTLRIMAQELGEQIYREMLAEYTVRDFPYLASLGERLKEYEAERGRYKTLKEFYPRLATIFRPSPESDTDSRVRRLKDEGVKEFMEGRFTDAAKTFTDALALAPKDPETLLNIGVVYEKLGKKSKALESYGRAIDLGAANSARARELKVSAYSSRATLLFSLGRAAEARQDIRRALEAAPSDWEGREDLEHRLSP